MNKEIKGHIGFIARLIAGLTLATAGFQKALASHTFLAWQLQGLGLPDFSCSFLAYVIPYAELNLGLMLITGLFLPVAASALAIALAIEEIIMLQAWLRMLPAAGLNIFGIYFASSAAWAIFQNALLIVLLYPATFSGKRLTLDFLIENNISRRFK